MIWDIFRPVNSISYPNNPGEYLGSIDLPEKRVDGIDHNLMQFDLYLRQANLKAYGEKYKLVQSRKPYTGFAIKSKNSVSIKLPSLGEQIQSTQNKTITAPPSSNNKISYKDHSKR